jgi:hypothetical protein
MVSAALACARLREWAILPDFQERRIDSLLLRSKTDRSSSHSGAPVPLHLD